MSNQMAQLQEATIKVHCKTLRMPMIASQFGTLAEQAIREKKSHVGYLEALLLAEVEERERNTIERRIREAHLPRVLMAPAEVEKPLSRDPATRSASLSRTCLGKTATTKPGSNKRSHSLATKAASCRPSKLYWPSTSLLV